MLRRSRSTRDVDCNELVLVGDEMRESFSDKITAIVFGIFFLMLVSIFVDCLKTDGSISSCYLSTHWTTSSDYTYSLYGNVKYRADRKIAGPFKSFDEAVAAAKLYGCELK